MSNLAIVQNAYQAFGRGDIESVVAALDPDIEWIEGEIEGLPYAGPHHGPRRSSTRSSPRFRRPTTASSLCRRSGSMAGTRS